MNQLSSKIPHAARRSAFTIIELLTVVTCITILMSISIPIARSLQNKAHRVRTKAQFSQWSTAMELFRAEYGGYPRVDGSYGSGKGISRENVINGEKFAVALTGNKLSGSSNELRSPTIQPIKLVGNTKLLSFYSIGQKDLDENGFLVDSYLNQEIGILYDVTMNGTIDSNDRNKTPDVDGVNGGKYSLSSDTEVMNNLTKGIRAGVVFYSAGAGNSGDGAVESDVAVRSW